MNNDRIEIRTIAECQLSAREQTGNEAGESRTIRGYAIVFNQESEVLDEFGQPFREIITPECCSMEWLRSQDIKMNMLHDRQLTLARWNRGEGTLRLWTDDHGVGFEFEAPKCDIGDRCLEMVSRGDYSGCSFEFWPQDWETVDREDGLLIIHRKFRMLSAVTIGMDPAYRQTSVNVREIQGRKAEEETLQEPAADTLTRERELAEAEAQAREREISMFHQLILFQND